MTLHFGTGVELNGYGILQLSPDGYVRLTLDQFQAIALRHLWSGLDPEDTTSIHEGAVSTHITGYTEWVSETVPRLPLGGTGNCMGCQAERVTFERVRQGAILC